MSIRFLTITVQGRFAFAAINSLKIREFYGQRVFPICLLLYCGFPRVNMYYDQRDLGQGLKTLIVDGKVARNKVNHFNMYLCRASPGFMSHLVTSRAEVVVRKVPRACSLRGPHHIPLIDG